MIAYYDYTGFRSEGELADHMRRVHGPNRTKRVDCEYCSNKFKTFTDLEVHLASFHPGKQVKFSCDLCDTSTATLREMGLHRAEVHDVKKAYTCQRTCVNGEPCTVGFKSWYELNAHQKKEHDSDHTEELHPAKQHTAEPHTAGPPVETKRPSLCLLCGVDVGTAPSVRLLHDQVVHNIGTKLQCPDCEYVTCAPSRFKTHLVSHAPKTFVCPCCEYSTAYKHVMPRHMRAKHADYHE